MKSQQKYCTFHKTRCWDAKRSGFKSQNFWHNDIWFYGSVGFHMFFPERNTTFPAYGLDLFFPVKLVQYFQLLLSLKNYSMIMKGKCRIINYFSHHLVIYSNTEITSVCNQIWFYKCKNTKINYHFHGVFIDRS